VCHTRRRRFRFKKKDDPESPVVDRINRLADEINSVLNTHQKQKYFECTVLLYSFIENLLNSLLFVNSFWAILGKPVEIRDREVRDMERYFQRLSFYNSVQMALSTKLIDLALYRKIEKARRERNDVFHQLWLYEQRGNVSMLRNRLEALAEITNDLVTVLKRVNRKIGVPGVYMALLR